MRIGKRLFPYPTINNSKIASCFKNSNYSLEYDDESDNENLIVTRPTNTNVTYVNHEIESIGNHVFRQWTNELGYGLVGVDCSNVRTIGDFAFYDDFLLTSVNINSIGAYKILFSEIRSA